MVRTLTVETTSGPQPRSDRPSTRPRTHAVRGASLRLWRNRSNGHPGTSPGRGEFMRGDRAMPESGGLQGRGDGRVARVVATPADRPPASSRVSDPRWVRGGSEVGEIRVRAYVPGAEPATFANRKILVIPAFRVFTPHDTRQRVYSLRVETVPILPIPTRFYRSVVLRASGMRNGGDSLLIGGSSCIEEWEAMRTAATGLAARAGGGRWARKWRCSPGSVSPARGSKRMRPSWRTATSGRGGPTRRRGMRLGKRPGYLKPIERWSTLRDWRGRACAWDDHLQAERDQVAREEAAKWERRRLQALEDGWQTCRALRALLAQMLAIPPEMPAVAPPEPAREEPRALPDAVATPEEAGETAGRGSTRSNCLTLARLAKLIVELEWALPERGLAAPREVRPADGDGRGDQGLPGPPSPLRPTAPALSRPTPPPHFKWPHRTTARPDGRRPGRGPACSRVPGLVAPDRSPDRRRRLGRRFAPCEKMAGSGPGPRLADEPPSTTPRGLDSARPGASRPSDRARRVRIARVAPMRYDDGKLLTRVRVRRGQEADSLTAVIL